MTGAEDDGSFRYGQPKTWEEESTGVTGPQIGLELPQPRPQKADTVRKTHGFVVTLAF